MADYYSVREATAEYRLAISNSHDHLESFLVENRPWAYLERKKVFSLAELEVMKKKPTKTAIKLLLTALLEKGNIDTFISFSKALHTMSFDMGRQIFPFADRAGGIPVRLQQLKGTAHADLTVMSLSPSLSGMTSLQLVSGLIIGLLFCGW